jgi:teichuronic acid biosynthesis glycosyltransferase TuaC
VMQFPKEPGMRSIIQRVLREAACVIAVSPTLAEEITALAGPDLRVRTIVNGVDAERFHPMPRVEARASLGLPLDSRIILGVGHLVATKRWHLAVRALAVLPTDVHLHLIGSGEERGALEALAREVGVAERAHLHGAQPSEALPAWYGAADVFCLPSAREGCPNVVLEALACGRPVVATAVGNVPDLVREGVSGQLVHSDTPEALAETLRRALAREWDATLIVGRHARTWDDVAREVEQVWEGALSFRRQAALQEAEA